MDILAERYADKGVTVVAGFEARGLIFGAPLALRTAGGGGGNPDGALSRHPRILLDRLS